jgi:hypothetical protein
MERRRLWELGNKVVSWDQLDVNDLKYNQHCKNIIGNIIKSNQSNKAINIQSLQSNLLTLGKSIEFYLDFEFVNDLDDDFSHFPMGSSSKYIYMVGWLYVNHIKSEVKYFNFLVNRLNKDQEISMINSWLDEMASLNNNQKNITIYHWGQQKNCSLNLIYHQIINY